jgi:hypothetical protein
MSETPRLSDEGLERAIIRALLAGEVSALEDETHRARKEEERLTRLVSAPPVVTRELARAREGRDKAEAELKAAREEIAALTCAAMREHESCFGALNFEEARADKAEAELKAARQCPSCEECGCAEFRVVHDVVCIENTRPKATADKLREAAADVVVDLDHWTEAVGKIVDTRTATPWRALEKLRAALAGEKEKP